MGGSKRRNKKKFYAVVTSDGTKIFEVWDDRLTFMKGKKKVKQKESLIERMLKILSKLIQHKINPVLMTP